MASSKANGRAPDTDEEKSVPTAVVNYPTGAQLLVRHRMRCLREVYAPPQML